MIEGIVTMVKQNVDTVAAEAMPLLPAASQPEARQALQEFDDVASAIIATTDGAPIGDKAAKFAPALNDVLGILPVPPLVRMGIMGLSTIVIGLLPHATVTSLQR
jgi:hypothetical protein